MPERSGKASFEPQTTAPRKAINDGLPNLNINSLCFKGTYLFAGTGGGIFRSSDGGAAWSQVNNGLTSTNVRAVATDGSFLFAATDGGGICRSTDDGANWAPVNNGLLTNVTYYSLAVVPDPAGSRGHAILAGSGIGAHRSRNDVKKGIPIRPYVPLACNSRLRFRGASYRRPYRCERSVCCDEWRRLSLDRLRVELASPPREQRALKPVLVARLRLAVSASSAAHLEAHASQPIQERAGSLSGSV